MAGTVPRAAALALSLALAPAAAAVLDCPAVNYSCAASNQAVSHAGRATVWIKVPAAGQCTGTLVNNLRGDGRPYILTARHCAGGASDAELPERAAEMEIRYGYVLPCGAAAPTSAGTTRGAIHRASFADIWLVEAQAPPPVSADAWLAGINVPGSDAGSTFGVHHGNGLPRQYVQQTVLGSTVAYIVFGPLNELLQLWSTSLERGSTPHGSSGSALFDQHSRVMGVLSGGIICAGDPAGNEYSKIAQSWNGGYTPAQSLKAWLDPDGRGATVFDGGERASLAAAPRSPANAAAGGDTGGGGALGGMGVLLILAGGRRLRRRWRTA